MNTKKFRSSAAPKGTKLRPGYHDRTQLRTSGEEDDKASRVRALEDMVKLGQMEFTTFEALRDEIVGGDVKDVHLVKGLDYKLLERVRRGEDVLADAGKSEPSNESRANEPEEPVADFDEEFDKLEEKEIQPVAKVENTKKGEMRPPPPSSSKKRTRDDILKELKASRQAMAEKIKQSRLGPRFTKVGERREKSRVEKNEQGREVLITVDADGRVKRKVKRNLIENASIHGPSLPMPDKDAKPLGMEVTPIAPPKSPSEEDGDIFEGVGADYNPLGHVSGDEDSSGSSEEDELSADAKLASSPPPSEKPESENFNMPPPPVVRHKSPPNQKRNYFGESEEDASNAMDSQAKSLTDPTIVAAIKKASTIQPLDSLPSNEEEIAKSARRKKMLDSHDRDAEDMDISFGGSRFGDEEEGDEKRVKLSTWVEGGGNSGDGKADAKGKRRRGPKKKKGDVNNAADVLNVIKRRKEEK